MKNKYGFVYIWRDRKHNRYYIGSHWGFEDDNYICSSKWMKNSYDRRKADFKRRIICRVYTNKKDLLEMEQHWFNMVKPEEIKIRYYNLNLNTKMGHWSAKENALTIGQKISFKNKGVKQGPRKEGSGKNISEAKKAKFQAKIAAGLPAFSDEHKEKMSQARIGKTHSDNWKSNMSEIVSKQWEHGIRNGNHAIGRIKSEEERNKISRALTGKALTEEHKKSISETQKGKPNLSLKNKWADPIWAANQKLKLSEGAKRRRLRESLL